jgi:hypothetical protein
MAEGTFYERARHMQRRWDKESAVEAAVAQELRARGTDWSPCEEEISEFISDALETLGLDGAVWDEFITELVREHVQS